MIKYTKCDDQCAITVFGSLFPWVISQTHNCFKCKQHANVTYGNFGDTASLHVTEICIPQSSQFLRIHTSSLGLSAMRGRIVWVSLLDCGCFINCELLQHGDVTKEVANSQ